MDFKKLLRKPRPVSVPIAETGDSVFMRYWTFAEKDRYLASFLAWQGSQDEAAGEAHVCEVLRNTLVDAEGDPVYGPDDNAEVMQIPAVPLFAIYNAAMKLNTPGRDNVEAAGKNLGQTPSDVGSSSDQKTTVVCPANSPTG